MRRFAFKAAIAAVMEMLPVPGRVVVAGDAYNGTRRFLTDVSGRGRLRFRTVDVTDTAATLTACAEVVEAPGRPSGAPGQFGDRGLLWLESPTNPLLAVADLEALIDGAHQLGMDVAVDNTFATPYLQQPLALGADLVVHSTTKYLGGHSDVVGGFVATDDPELADEVAFYQNAVGGVPGPLDCYLVLRGAKTLAVRMDRHCANAEAVVEMLVAHPAVSRVLYPGLASHPGHDLAARQMRGFGGMVSFVVAAGEAAALEVVRSTTLWTLAESLGAVESLIEHPHRMTHSSVAGSPLEVDPGLVRLSVGLETASDLLADLSAALDRAGN